MSSSASSAVRENASGVLYDLLTDAAGAGLLEKAVFSKCRDRAVVRIVLTLRLVRNNVVLQAETFRQAEVAAVSGKTKPVQAGQENLPLDSPSGQTRDQSQRRRLHPLPDCPGGQKQRPQHRPQNFQSQPNSGQPNQPVQPPPLHPQHRFHRNHPFARPFFCKSFAEGTIRAQSGIKG